jgi:phenylpropionate dioxygenase-like ring-hydroxylating dioxygenase large terminal subunit
VSFVAVATPPTLRSRLLDGATLPAWWYSDPEVLRLEHERIFNRSWQYAGPAEQASAPGSFFTCRAGATPIVVVRDRSGKLRAFVNVCRHRGHEVAQGCGQRETLQCPYHAWTYDLDGSLRAAPRSEREAAFDRADLGLRPVLVDTWGPLVFVNPDGDAPPLGDVLRDLPRETAERGLELVGLVYRGRSREQIIDANWKIVVENFLECYHCPVAHKSFSRLIDVDPDAYTLSTARWTSSQYGPPQAGDDLPYDPAGDMRTSQFHFIWPNWTLNVLPGAAHVRVIVFQPLDADRTASFVDGFWAPDTPDEIIEEITSFGAKVGAEDRELVESVHRGLRSGAIDHGRLLLGSEKLIQHFHLLVYDALDEDSSPRTDDPVQRAYK